MPATNGATERWLKCRVEKGMFSDEKVVSYPSIGTAVASAFVPTEEIGSVEGNIGKVRVTVQKRGGATIARIPSSYGDYVEVAEQDLMDAQ